MLQALHYKGMSKKPQTFIFLGRSGCGKGTQAKLLIEHLAKETGIEAYYIESGATFRSFIKEEGYTNGLAKEVADRGGLQPEFLSIWVWSNVLVGSFQDKRKHLVFDGMPRKVFEAPVFDAALDFYAREERFFIHLDVSEAWAYERLMARKRADDTPEYIANRLAWYKSDVEPTINYFKTSGAYRYLRIPGEQSIAEVQAAIVKGIAHGSKN